ncbi:right-handed parallel beta-helix repeat-containing protein [Actinoplanes sp. KI2]|uniref:right-handed parallel beta-helix repeat-containing protein n=1 Tax=Actinoplanes sp. KI2 TaxID=2983315 RepID=UPI0021D5DD02|nr:right-handed parallel beta-helix repeat-containing protein [Actinoplanes sp. KI2]MCU7726407.1 right-handed parallel beta-helix repeat-containing protein [Actinoplanes sp. KI2]
MSKHRRFGVARLLFRPLLVVPAILLIVAATTAVVWLSRDDADENSGCAAGGVDCVAEPLPGTSSGSKSAAARSAPSSARSLGPAATASSSPSTEAASAQTSGKPTGPCASGPACGYPSAGSTGPRKAPSIRKSGNISITKKGQVLDGWNLAGSLDIYASNVTVTNCNITSRNWWGINLRPGFTGLVVTHCKITDTPGEGPDNGGSNYAISNMSDGSIEVGFNDISGFGNVLSMGHGTIHDNYVHNMSTFVTQSGEWQHTDSVISNGSDNGGLVVRHNTLLNESTIDKGATAAVGLFADNGPVRNTTVQDNWMAGGAYVLYGGGAGSSNVHVIDNVFSTQLHPKGGIYGFAAAWNRSGPGNVWSGNRTSDGVPIPPPSL